jgi:TRAP-type C4-dicarboxylate transport system permease large subunit
VVKGIAPDVPMNTIFRGIWPFWFAMMAAIAILLVFPQIALFLPNTMFN